MLAPRMSISASSSGFVGGSARTGKDGSAEVVHKPVHGEAVTSDASGAMAGAEATVSEGHAATGTARS